MANSRYYSSIAQQTTLTSGITPSGTTMIVAATTGFPGSLPYTLAVDYGSATEELVEVTGVAGTTLTVTRAIDGTSGASHNPGAVVRHVSSARDFTDSRTHEAASTNVHGLSGGAAVVGTTSTQTLTNKTLTHVLGSADNFKLYNKGATGVTQVIGDSANPGANRLEILDNEVSLNVMVSITSTGDIKMFRNSGDTDTTYRVRLVDTDGTTDRFAVLAGGTIAIAPTSATTQVALDIVAPDTSTSKRAIRVAASGGGTERFTVWNDGRVDIVGSAASFSTLDVTAPASVSADIMRVLDSGSNTQWGVQSTGKMLANKGATIVQPGVTSGAVLQVGGSNVGYTGNLTQWVAPSNTIVSRIDETGKYFGTAASLTSTLDVTGTGTFNAGGFATTLSTPSGSNTAATGWSVTSTTARVIGGVAYILVVFQRTGTTITADGAGNIGDSDAFTLPAAMLPNAGVYGSNTIPFNVTDGFGEGSGRLAADTGVFTMVAWSPNGTLQSGRSPRVFMTYPV